MTGHFDSKTRADARRRTAKDGEEPRADPTRTRENAQEQAARTPASTRAACRRGRRRQRSAREGAPQLAWLCGAKHTAGTAVDGQHRQRAAASTAAQQHIARARNGRQPRHARTAHANVGPYGARIPGSHSLCARSHLGHGRAVRAKRSGFEGPPAPGLRCCCTPAPAAFRRTEGPPAGDAPARRGTATATMTSLSASFTNLRNKLSGGKSIDFEQEEYAGPHCLCVCARARMRRPPTLTLRAAARPAFAPGRLDGRRPRSR